ncbi:MAG: hypothetical protein NC124_19190 [Clostridium sp.]|nr:hypothetical protein [Clostridium sp.]
MSIEGQIAMRKTLFFQLGFGNVRFVHGDREGRWQPEGRMLQYWTIQKEQTNRRKENQKT